MAREKNGENRKVWCVKKSESAAMILHFYIVPLLHSLLLLTYFYFFSLFPHTLSLPLLTCSFFLSLFPHTHTHTHTHTLSLPLSLCSVEGSRLPRTTRAGSSLCASSTWATTSTSSSRVRAFTFFQARALSVLNVLDFFRFMCICLGFLSFFVAV